MQIGFIASLFFAILVAVFALKNGNSVLIDFLFSKVEISQAIVIFVSAALGAVIVTILGLLRQIKLTIKIKEQSKKINSMENENKELKSIIENFSNEGNKNMTNADKDKNDEKDEIIDNANIQNEFTDIDLDEDNN